MSDESVDAYTIAFDTRNCTHVDKAVKQTYRVLKKGGYFMCFEFNKEKFAQIIRDAGFKAVGEGYKNFTFSVQTEADSCSKTSL
ncbi:hypothetical protein RO3G_13667 [Rhizopus delemar RA 99-880]|uniref:Methyltransferase type 11 domain-containing protein n=1 Tax=Rhizopus delemar (strain RA 99-880 / ATCC MYA-4621 / FGSC 9543 / NRRL 43880) TaxID=246409 RepID=I1CKH6_RHIO9|nr:hypothetical protein RO3G_13667 [Rhizopus delemar RA 99-880]|eukprot:EIE88956.1 hypothetical protein RO3G_13667 [Rhizopus delemar RA 99-880]